MKKITKEQRAEQMRMRRESKESWLIAWKFVSTVAAIAFVLAGHPFAAFVFVSFRFISAIESWEFNPIRFHDVTPETVEYKVVQPGEFDVEVEPRKCVLCGFDFLADKDKAEEVICASCRPF